jgi:hypothetical protein
MEKGQGKVGSQTAGGHMTEAEWLQCDDPTAMLESLPDKISKRKLRLFGCACCRTVWRLLAGIQWRKVVLVAERYADGQASAQALAKVTREAYFAPIKDWKETEWATLVAAEFLARPTLTIKGIVKLFNYLNEPIAEDDTNSVDRTAYSTLPTLLRDVVGNPFRPAVRVPGWLSWNGGVVANLAQAIYEERAFDRLPILGDALEDAGCGDEAILTHCRSGGEHVRGCWVVDLLLGKE